MNSSSNKILCFGELLLHFAPDSDGNWLNEQVMKIFVGGAEYNVASALAQWQNPVKLLSALPENFVGDQLEIQLQNKGIKVLAEKSNGRIGTFYLSSDGDMQNASVVYDRFPSVFTQSDFSQFSFDEIFSEVKWLHISTITPALSEKAYNKCLELMSESAKRNITISLDLNYRSALWKDRNPSELVRNMMPFVNVLMGNIWSIQQFLEIPIEYELNGNFDDENLLKQAEKSAFEVQKQFPNVEMIANTFRFTNGEKVNYYATLFTDELLVSEQYQSDKVEERVGSGDSFMAALIHGKIKGNPSQQILDDATKVAFRKLFVKGDTIDESINIEKL
ncbi:PfkB family carbohydrate kinase [Epilithonimonas mollis]|uniref:2-dehydro-3-deoxygluconokinase n=1 Tax=Epilithonimonas mollis TaxID=216903 RepID=A0A1M6N603_9FLAO|nr:PfkB family carbohydrate kinase [Epilithonimonas mollis]SHJ91175.1 2-dehydro-3-deoxygluconokinase [Epilithonimonas mollis]